MFSYGQRKKKIKRLSLLGVFFLSGWPSVQACNRSLWSACSPVIHDLRPILVTHKNSGGYQEVSPPLNKFQDQPSASSDRDAIKQTPLINRAPRTEEYSSPAAVWIVILRSSSCFPVILTWYTLIVHFLFLSPIYSCACLLMSTFALLPRQRKKIDKNQSVSGFAW